jgi:hypothetical protein
MHDKLKTFKAYKSNRRLICYFIGLWDFWTFGSRTKGVRVSGTKNKD